MQDAYNDIYRMRYFLVLVIMFLATLSFSSCHESLEQRAAREADEFTRKNCPTPVKDDTRTDSLVFNEDSRTLVYYYTLSGKADNPAVIEANKAKLKEILRTTVANATQLRIYKEAGFSFRYVYHSAAHPDSVLLDLTFTSADL